MENEKREYIGFTRVVDTNNRVVIPKEVRELLNIKPYDELEFKLVQLSKGKKVIEINKKGD